MRRSVTGIDLEGSLDQFERLDAVGRKKLSLGLGGGCVYRGRNIPPGSEASA